MWKDINLSKHKWIQRKSNIYLIWLWKHFNVFILNQQLFIYSIYGLFPPCPFWATIQWLFPATFVQESAILGIKNTQVEVKWRIHVFKKLKTCRQVLQMKALMEKGKNAVKDNIFFRS